MPRVAMFARRDISKGEELTFDYNSPLGKFFCFSYLNRKYGSYGNNNYCMPPIY